MNTTHATILSLLLSTLVLQAVAQPTNCRFGIPREQCEPLEPNDPKYEAFSTRPCHQVREIDGVCTNPNNGKKLWGAARVAHYSYFIPKSTRNPTGTSRNSARLISNTVCSQTDNKFSKRGLTEFLVFFGQFLDHNIVQTAVNEGDHMDIPIPRDDPVFGNFTGGKLPFSRSVRARASTSSPDVRPANLLSSAVDLSAVYSSNQVRLNMLRDGKTCYLKTSAGNYLPKNTGGLVNEPSTSKDFYAAGDVRANENPTLTAIQTIFLREHNRICDSLQRVTRSGQKQYEMARRVNIAQFQKIVFDEFFPAIVGKRLPRYRRFNSGVNVGISLIFSTAAFRIGHTMIGNDLKLRGRGNSALRSFPAREMFFRKASVFESFGVEPFLRGAVQARSQEVDVEVMDSLRQILFSNVPQLKTGIDLVALNLQRGRDHALPSYNSVRSKFGLSSVSSFSQVTTNRALQTKLQAVYSRPDDMDIWIALLAEDHVSGSSMGPTMRAIWMREFARLRDGDSLYYEGPRHFTGALLEAFPQLRKLKREKNLMRKIILRNSDITESELPTNVFKR